MTQQQHIFVVDDEAPARDMIGDYLKMHGFEVTLCDGGKALAPRSSRRAAISWCSTSTCRRRTGCRSSASSSSRQRAGDHADRDREPDRPGGRAGAWRRRLSRQAVRTARASGARPLGAAPERCCTSRRRRPGRQTGPSEWAPNGSISTPARSATRRETSIR